MLRVGIPPLNTTVCQMFRSKFTVYFEANSRLFPVSVVFRPFFIWLNCIAICGQGDANQLALARTAL